MKTLDKHLVLSLILLFSIIKGYSQKAIIKAKLLDSSSIDASKFIFQIEIENKGFDKYWIQDTSFLKNHLEYPGGNLIYPYLEQKVNGGYGIYENYKHRAGVGFRNACLDSCCNCIILGKGESLKIDLPILTCYYMEPGQYRMLVNFGPPLYACDACEQIREINSKYVYFVVEKR